MSRDEQFKFVHNKKYHAKVDPSFIVKLLIKVQYIKDFKHVVEAII